MRILGIIFALLFLLIGLRLVVTALQTALTGRVLVRKGFRSTWHPVQDMNDAWKAAFRDGLMGVLLIALGAAMIT
jgi:hypothetical protein